MTPKKKYKKRIWINLALSDDVVRQILRVTDETDMNLYLFIENAIIEKLRSINNVNGPEPETGGPRFKPFLGLRNL